MGRILFIPPVTLTPGSPAHIRICYTLRILAEAGYSVDTLTVRGYPELPGAAIGRHRVPLLPFCSRLPASHSLRRGLLEILLLSRAVMLAARHRYDLIHGVDDGGRLASVASRLTRIPFLYDHFATLLPPPNGYRRLLGRLAERSRLKAWATARVVVGPHDHTLADALVRLGRSGRGCILPEFPSLAEPPSVPSVNLARARYTRDPSQPVILFALWNPEAIPAGTLPAACRSILAHCPSASLVACTPAGQPAGIPADIPVQQAGDLPESEWLSLVTVARVIVLQSAADRLPPRFLDCFRYGRPIVLVGQQERIPFLREAVLTTRPDPEPIARAVLWLVANPRQAESLGLKGASLLNQFHFSAEGFRTILLRCYTYALNPKGPGPSTP